MISIRVFLTHIIWHSICSIFQRYETSWWNTVWPSFLDCFEEDQRKEASGVTSHLLAGMIILFGSTQIDSLLYGAYPPWNVDIIYASRFIPAIYWYLYLCQNSSQDGRLRKEFYKSAESHLALLKTIGVTEMERSLEKRYKYVSNIDLTDDLLANGDTNLEQQDIKEIIHDVLNELNSNKKLGTQKR